MYVIYEYTLWVLASPLWQYQKLVKHGKNRRSRSFNSGNTMPPVISSCSLAPISSVIFMQLTTQISLRCARSLAIEDTNAFFTLLHDLISIFSRFCSLCNMESEITVSSLLQRCTVSVFSFLKEEDTLL